MYSLVAEDFRILDAKLSLINAHEPFRTMMVTSPASSEGKSVVVANLATDMVRNGKKVIVVDADLRLPRLHQLFGVNLSPGLSEHLSNREIDLPIQLAESNGVLVMPSGYVPPNPTELLYSPNLPGLLNRLSQMADIVLIDCPPVLPMADSIILAPKTDGVLLVMRSGVTKSRAVRDTIEHLRSARVRIIGTVLNGSPKRANGYRYYRRNGKGKLLDQKDKQVYTVKAA
jgi:capsular exopolysaccharide synthesis family protein